MNTITTKDIEEDNNKCRIYCSIYITSITLDDFAREMTKLSKKYKGYKIENVGVAPAPEKIGVDLFLNIIKK